MPEPKPELWPHGAIYLSGTVASYWRWGENQEIAWSDGPTIAFWPEVTAVLSRLAPDGLPPFGAVLLLLAACRENWSSSPSRRELLAAALGLERHASSSLLNDVCEGLEKVHALPPELRGSPAAKAELAVVVFENMKGRLSPTVSQEIVESLTAWKGHSSAAPPKDSSFWLTRDLGALRDGLSRVDEQALRHRVRTGLEAPPAPAPIEVPPLTGRAWLGWLEQQDEFAGLALLAKRLLAAIHIPRHLNEPDELPLGGITDIAPRGPLDRLLLSELAHDDLTLAVRVAMNEALYLRRESPPRTPPHHRHILLDAGLRLWGLPRVYATAVALAMTAHDDPHLKVQVHRPSGAKLKAIAMNTADGLRSHLAALDHRLHPGESLPSLAELIEESEGGDAVVVTSDDTLSDPAFQRALERSGIGSVYFAAVARDGRFELQHYSPAGRKSVSKAQLPLEEILGSPRRAATLRDIDKSPLPAIFRAEPFPLLLCAPVNLDNSWHVHEIGVLTSTGDGRLLRWNINTQGAEQLATGLPAGRIFGASGPLNGSGQVCLILGRLSSRGLYAVFLSHDGTVDATVPLGHGGIGSPAVLVDQTVAYIANNRRVVAVDLTSLDLQALETVASVSATAVREGCVCEAVSQLDGTWAWYRPSLRGERVEYVMVCRKELLRMFDARGVEGPVGITPEGHIYFTGNQETKTVNHGLPLPIRCAAVSRDGLRFVLHHQGSPLATPPARPAGGGVRFGVNQGDQYRLVHTLNGSVRECRNSIHDIEPFLHLRARPRNLRSRFQSVGVDSQGNLCLINSKRRAFAIQMPSLTFPDSPKPAVTSVAFEAWKHDGVAGFKLHRAVFPDGSIAVLDSRGLLHLRSADANIPECTIVLREGPTAGWCADGRAWGPKYYLGSRFDKATPAEAIARDILGPFLERLQ